MFKYIILGLLGFSLACSTSKNSIENETELYSFKIELTTTSDYCGGVSPTPEVEEELNTPIPRPNTKIHFRKGSSNAIDEEIDYTFTSDENGVVKGKLPLGTYSIVYSDKKDREAFSKVYDNYKDGTPSHKPINKECLENHFAKPEGLLEIEKDKQNELKLNYRKPCPWMAIPCTVYTGNLPPSVGREE